MNLALHMAKSWEKLRAFTDEKDVKITTLMEGVRLSRATVSAHLNGYREPDWEQRRRYEAFLRLPDMWLEPDPDDDTGSAIPRRIGRPAPIKKLDLSFTSAEAAALADIASDRNISAENTVKALIIEEWERLEGYKRKAARGSGKTKG